MKSKKVMALLLSMALSISTCVPLGSITALGAETDVTVQAAAAEETVSESAQEAEETEDSSEAEASESAAAEEETAAEEVSNETVPADDREESAEETAADEASEENTEEKESGSAEAETVENETEETTAADDASGRKAEDAGDAAGDEAEDAVDAADDEAEDAGDAADDEAEDAVPANDADSTGTDTAAADEEADTAASEESAAPAADSSEEDTAKGSTVITAPAETDSIKTDAQNGESLSSDADFSGAIEIKAGDVNDVSITEENGYVLYRFVPEETAEYVFYSSDYSDDPCCYLYDSNKSELTCSDDSEDLNFRLRYAFTAGDTYYFQACMTGDNTGTYTVHLEKPDLNCIRIGDGERTVSINEEITLEVSASSSSAISYQWYNTHDDPIQGATSAAYTFTPQESGYYYCYITDENGDSSSINFLISISNHLTAYTVDEYGEDTNNLSIYAALNDSVDLNVTVSADDMTDLTYEWYDGNGTPIEGADSESYTTDPVTGPETYEFRVTDRYNNSYSVYFYIYVDNHLTAYTVDECGDKVNGVNIYAASNDSVDLNVTVSADDMTALTYEWYDGNGTPIEGADSKSYTTDPLTGTESYEFKVTDQYDNSCCVYFYINIDNHLTAECSNGSRQMDILAVPGDSIELKPTVYADDMTALTYEWYKSENNSYSYDVEWIQIDGADSSTYKVDSASANSSYKFLVRDQYDNSKECCFDVYVNHFEAYPEGNLEYDNSKTIYCKPGEKLSLNITVSADDESQISYEWYEDDSLIENAVGKSLVFNSVDHNHFYRCEVSDPYGNYTTVEFDVYVNHLEAYASNTYKSCTTIYLSKDESLDLGIDVSADDTSQITYKWYDADYNLIESASGPSYQSDDHLSKNTAYSCEVEDPYGNSESVYFDICLNHFDAYSVTDSIIDEDAEYYERHTSFYVKPGESVDLEVVAYADDTSQITYKWYDDDNNLIEDASGPLYTVDSVESEQSYRCRVSDQYNNYRSLDFNIYVNHFEVHPEGEKNSYKDIDVVPDGSALLKVDVSADDISQLTYEWYDSDSNLIEDISGPEYRVDHIMEPQHYRCTVRDQYDNQKTAYYYISLNNFIVYPEGESEGSDSTDIYASYGESVDLKALVSADDTSQLTYKWYIDYDEIIEGASGPSYTVDSVKRYQRYNCEVSDQFGNEESITFNVHVQNHLTAYPKGESTESRSKEIYVKYGETVNLDVLVEADNKDQLVYEWNADYGEDNNTAASSYTTPPIRRNNTYTCYVTDQYDNFAEVKFNINVDNNFIAYPQGGTKDSNTTDLYVLPGESVILKAIISADNDKGLTYKWSETIQTAYSEKDDYQTISSTRGAALRTVPLSADKSYKLSVSDIYGNTREVFFNVIVSESAKTYITEEDVTVAGTTFAYNGKEKKPAVTVTVDGNTLTAGTDYTLTYSNNINAGTNTAVVTVTGIGSFEGTVEKNFSINKRTLTAAHVTVAGTAFTYNGKEKKPAVTVTVDSKALTAGTDYTLAYSNNINAGTNTAVVTVTGKGNFKGTAVKNFSINKATQVITAKASAAKVAVGKTATITITGNKGTKSYKTSNAAVAAVSSAGTVTAKKVGTVTITAVAGSTTNYKYASKKFTIKVVPGMTSSLTASNQVSGIKLTWAKVTGANGYLIYRNGSRIKTITSGTTVTYYDKAATANGAKYTYKIVAKASTGASTLSRSRVIYRLPRPAISSAANTAAGRMTVKWAKNAKATGYQVQYSLSKTFASGNKTLTVTSPSTVTKVIGSLTKGKTYYVRIRTYKAAGSARYYSFWSAVKTVKITR